MAAQFDAVAEAIGAFKKFFQKRNWFIAAPVLAGQLVAGFPIGILLFAFYGVLFAQAFSRPEHPVVTPFLAAFAVTIALAILFAFVVVTFAYAWTLAAAEPIWTGGEPALERGFHRAAASLLQLLVFELLIALLSIASLIVIVGPVIVAVLAMYGPPYIVLGGRSATQAIGDSFRLASANLGETLILVLAFIVVWICALVVIPLVIFVPIGPIAAACIMRSYVALAIVRFYGLLNARAVPAS